MSLGMKELNFGIEVEVINSRGRHHVAQAIQKVVGGTIDHVAYPTCYDPYHVTDTKGRIWKVVADGSINAPFSMQAEIVSPILKYEDIPELQEVIRSVRKAKSRVDYSTGIHLHIGAESFTPKAVCNLVKMVHKHEILIEQALGMEAHRRNNYCKRVDKIFLDKIEKQPPRTMEELNIAWYGYHNTHPDHYDRSRYRSLNVHALFCGPKTLEWRACNSTLHAGKVRAYLTFILALAAKALRMRSASSKRRVFDEVSAKYSFRCLILALSLSGDEFKNVRKHLLANLTGSAAWRNGRPQQGPRILAEAA